MNRIIALMAVALCTFVAQAQTLSSADYTMTVLPLDSATSINKNGAIAGSAGGAAAIYSQGTVVVLRSPANSITLRATDIADSGYIVGYGESSTSARQSLFWASATSDPIDIGSSLGQFVIPMSVNSQGAVAGYYSVEAKGTKHAFRWSPTAGVATIDPPNSTQSFAMDISESGYITGDVFYSDASHTAPRWYPSGAFGTITFTGSGTRALTNGSVIGTGSNGSTLWSISNTPALLTANPQANNVLQMSSRGRLVGYYLNPSSHYQAFTMESPIVPVTYLPIPPGVTDSFAYDVNECGTIVGEIVLTDGTHKIVTWSRPSCDPQTFVTVPDLHGIDLTTSTARLQQAALFPGQTNFVVSSCDQVGLIVAQSPSANSQAQQAS
ncbi:MAG TPA: hypothetical protein VET48_03910, partial [Steroidobacteraceae bacterium]|nr:hypothetical protein [Steroidobacteraceae bacterium]